MSQRQPSLARRAFPAIALSAVGVSMVHALDRPAIPVAGGLGNVSAADANTATTTIAPVDTTATTLAPSGGASAAGGVPTATVAPSATTVAPVVTAAPATAAPAVSECGALTGTGAPGDITERRNYGTVTVKAKFTADGTLCSASATYQVYDQKSVRYEEYSIPILNKQAEAAHSANINGISGATAVSNGYRASLQSAIDNKH